MDPRAMIIEEGEEMVPKEAKLVKVPTYIQRPRTWRKVDPAKRRRMATARKLSRSIHPHLRHRSRTEIVGNPTVCEQHPVVLPSPFLQRSQSLLPFPILSKRFLIPTRTN